MKIDPYQNKERYFKWKAKTRDGIPGISASNSNLIKKYIFDMERGLNVSGSAKKGARSYPRLNSLRSRLLVLTKLIESNFNLDNLVDISEEQLFKMFLGMRNGEILTSQNKKYNAVRDYVKDFKSFWHWYQKIKKKEGIKVEDITMDLDVSRAKPKGV
jgi:hypothetical protein